MAKKHKGGHHSTHSAKHHAHHHGHARGHGKHPHIGPITHDDMVSLHGSHGSGHSDNHASEEYREQNKAHGMDAGLSPAGGYHGHDHKGGNGQPTGGAPSMHDNCSYE